MAEAAVAPSDDWTYLAIVRLGRAGIFKYDVPVVIWCSRVYFQQFSMRATLLVFAAIGAQACQRERVFQQHPHKHVKRQDSNSTFPPVLDPNEQILLDSFDNTSISTWSYYYSACCGNFTRGIRVDISQPMGTILQERTSPWVSILNVETLGET